MELYLTVILIISILIFSVRSHQENLTRRTQLKSHGIQNISAIKKLINLIQIHRGLSSAWLNGDKSKKVNLQRTVQEIKTITRELNNKDSLKESQRWLSFIDHWSRLSQKAINANANDSFNQHTQLIANLLYLLEDEAEHSDLNVNHLPELPNIGFIWRELLVTAENIGQSRAIGIGVATTKVCSSVDKIRLSFLHKHIQQTTSEILVKINALNDAKSAHEKYLRTAKSKIALYTRTMQQEILEKNQITIDQNEYFSLASESMKALDDIFFHQLSQVKQLI